MDFYQASMKTENSDTLLVGPDEKRIMASVEKTRANHLRRCAAAKLIQCAWRVYHFKRLMEIAAQKVDNTNGKKQRRLTLFKHLHRLRESHILERDFSDALWQWRQVKHSTNNVDTSLGIKNFDCTQTARNLDIQIRSFALMIQQLLLRIFRANLVRISLFRPIQTFQTSDSLENLVRRGAMYTKRKKSSHDRILMADFHDCDENCSEKCPYEQEQRDSQDTGENSTKFQIAWLTLHTTKLIETSFDYAFLFKNSETDNVQATNRIFNF